MKPLQKCGGFNVGVLLSTQKTFMAKEMRAGVKAAWIGGLCLIIGIVVTAIIQNLKNDNNHSQIQNVGEQKIDSGSINSYNAGRDVKIENNTYNGIRPIDTQIIKKEKKRLIVKENPQVKNQIINNEPNHGVQINEKNGIVVIPKPLQRNFTTNEAKHILKNYPIDFPIEVWLKGTDAESRNLFNQVVNVVKSLGFNNISTTTIGIYGTTEVIEKDFQYGIEDGKFIFSIYLQQ